MNMISFEFFPAWVMSNVTGEIVRPWHIIQVFRLVREARYLLRIEEGSPSWFLV